MSKNTDSDFFIAQNYLLQLIAEKKISSSTFVLYSFYRSISGFSEIKCSYNWIALNSGLSKGAISAGNKQLVKNNLIEIINYGPNRVYEIILKQNSNIPRRQLKAVDRSSPDEQVVHSMNTDDKSCSPAEQIKTDNKNNSYKDNTTSFSKDDAKFIKKFIEHWSYMYNGNTYLKQDFNKVKNIEHIQEAVKYIPTLWKLDEIDKWVKHSDHSISVFVTAYIQGHLQAHYVNTRQYWDDKNKISEI